MNKIKHLNRVLRSKINSLICLSIKELISSIRLIGNAILVTAFLSYCGPFNQEFRQRMINEWQKQIQQRTIPFSENFNLIEQLNDEATVRVRSDTDIFIFIA
jgi:hypothetical protein